MKEIEILGLDQKIYTDKLDNGLEVVLIPFETKNSYYISYTTKYGSVNLDFTLEDGKKYSSPKGIAHFLEHKMFEQENGEDPFTFFSKSGTGCNAGTSYNKTSYFVWGVNNIEENLNYLLDFVNTPYFTDENVEKEKGIIIQEIKMYDDNPDWVLTEEVQKSTFKNHPIRYDIAGYSETVNSITKEDLYKCYNTFYQNSNMLLVVSGKFDKDKIMKVIKNNETLNSRTSKTEIKKIKENEPLKVNEKYREIAMPNVVTSKLAIDVKLSLKDIKNKYSYYLYISAIISILFGSSSKFREEMYEKGLITYFSTGKMIVDDFLIIEFYAETDKSEQLSKEIFKCFKNASIKEEELERFKKVLIASKVMNSDNVQTLADVIIDDYITWNEIINDKIDKIRSMNYKELIKIKDELKLDNSATVLLHK